MRPSQLLYHSKEAAKKLRRDSLQSAKRAMLRWGVVPPPLRVQIDLTDGCNFRCPTCSKWQTPPSSQELSLGDWGTVLDRIAPIPLLGEIAVTGGEPFTRPDLLPFLTEAKQRGLRIVLITNGWFLSPEVVNMLEASGVARVSISLNSLDAAVHDETRGKAGSYARIMQAVEAWCAVPRRMELCLGAVVMQANCGELTSLARWAHEQRLTGIIFQVLAPPGAHYSFAGHERMPETPSGFEQDPLWVRDVATLEQQVRELLRMQQQGCPILNPPSQLRNFALYFKDPRAIRRLPCLGTLSRMYVDPFGDVRLCYGFPPIGNVLREDPRRLWRNAPARRTRSASRDCAGLCRMLNNNQ